MHQKLATKKNSLYNRHVIVSYKHASLDSHSMTILVLEGIKLEDVSPVPT